MSEVLRFGLWIIYHMHASSKKLKGILEDLTAPAEFHLDRNFAFESVIFPSPTLIQNANTFNVCTHEIIGISESLA